MSVSDIAAARVCGSHVLGLRHVGGGVASALRAQVLDDLLVAVLGRIDERRATEAIADIDLGLALLDQELDSVELALGRGEMQRSAGGRGRGRGGGVSSRLAARGAARYVPVVVVALIQVSARLERSAQ